MTIVKETCGEVELLAQGVAPRIDEDPIAVDHSDVRSLPPSVSLVIPALNEERNIADVLRRIPSFVGEVILVDGHSTDRTIEVARELRPDIRVVAQTGRGKGNALACGFAVCTGDIIVMLDCDGSTDPSEILRFVAALRTGADFAKGSRFIQGGGSADLTRIRRLGNRLLSVMVKVSFRTWFSDLCYGYNAFWRHCLPALGLEHELAPHDDPNTMRWGDGFEVETLINVRVAKSGLRIVEVPSFESKRVYGESNLRAVRDGWRVLQTIVRERRRRVAAKRIVSSPPVAVSGDVPADLEAAVGT